MRTGLLDQRTLLERELSIVTHNSDASRRLAEASSRLLEFAEKAETSFSVELLRRSSAVGKDAGADDQARSDFTGTVDPTQRNADGFADAKRMRDAIDVALALLDEVLQLVPREPRQAVAQDIADIFHEISEIAALGENAARNAIKGESR
jgi:hypothetical protein